MIRALLIVIAFSGASSGCCRALDDFAPSPGPDGADDPPTQNGEVVDLGDAAYPANNATAAAKHDWWVPKLAPNKYRVGYRMPDDSAASIRKRYHDWADSLGHKRVDENRFQWRPPRRCVGGLHCVYEELDDQDAPSIAPMARRFGSRLRQAKLDASQAASLVLTFVQNITYRIPKEEPFGVKPPTLVLKEREGDCDSKTLLAHIILRDLGIDSVLISSEAHKHTMLGVALPSGGTTFTYSGRRYAFVELTAKRAPMGYIDPRLLRPNDWRVVKMRYKAARLIGAEAPETGGKGDGDGGKGDGDKSRGKKPAPVRKPPSITDIIGGARIRIDR
jgi:Transglutaminase-like superfamily